MLSGNIREAKVGASMTIENLFKTIEQLKRYAGGYTVYDYETELLDGELQHPLERKVQAPPPENLSDEEWNNLMSNIGAKN